MYYDRLETVMPKNAAQIIDTQRFNVPCDAPEVEQNANFDAVMASIADLKAQYDYHWQLIISLSERVAILEARH